MSKPESDQAGPVSHGEAEREVRQKLGQLGGGARMHAAQCATLLAYIDQQRAREEEQSRRVAELEASLSWRRTAPVEVELRCPVCGKQHLDIGEFATRVHRQHLCENTTEGPNTGCGHLWQPFEYATKGVRLDEQSRELASAREELTEARAKVAELESQSQDSDADADAARQQQGLACAQLAEKNARIAELEAALSGDTVTLTDKLALAEGAIAESLDRAHRADRRADALRVALVKARGTVNVACRRGQGAHHEQLLDWTRQLDEAIAADEKAAGGVAGAVDLRTQLAWAEERNAEHEHRNGELLRMIELRYERMSRSTDPELRATLTPIANPVFPEHAWGPIFDGSKWCVRCGKEWHPSAQSPLGPCTFRSDVEYGRRYEPAPAPQHTCILTATTADGQPPPPCPACRVTPIDALIARSSLGTSEALATRAQADPAVVERVLARADELAAERGPSATGETKECLECRGHGGDGGHAPGVGWEFPCEPCKGTGRVPAGEEAKP